MAKKVLTVISDDLDQSEGASSITFGLDDQWFEIDLGEKNAANLREALAPFLAVASPIEFPVKAPVGRAGKRSGGPVAPATIRAWWKVDANRVKYELPEWADRGRLPEEVEKAYYLANPTR